MQDFTENPAGNDDFAWREFDPQAYVDHYYGDPHPDDDALVEATCRALQRAQADGDRLAVVDVGTGPNLFPWLSALPRAAQLTAWEYSAANVAWLEQQLRSDTLNQPWPHFWDIVRRSYGTMAALPHDPMPALQQRAKVVQGSIFDLPAGEWDAATMFFCAESITRRADEFATACERFARSVRPGGTLVAAFLAKSTGYRVATQDYPAVSVTAPDLEHLFSRFAAAISVTAIGLTAAEVRSGYSGMYFLEAQAR